MAVEPSAARNGWLRSLRRGRGAAGAGSQSTGRRPGNRAAYLYIVAAFVYLAVFVLYPIVKAVWISLTTTSLLSPTDNPYAGLVNYEFIFKNGIIQHALVVTFIFVVGVTVCSMILGVGAALLVETLSAGKSTARTLLALPWTIPSVVIALLFDLILDQQIGLANQILRLANLSVVNWLTNDTIALISVTGVTIWNLFPFVMLVTMAALQTVPAELYDSAAVDGAERWAMARHITLPFISPTLQVVSLFLVIWAFQQFQVLWIMTQGGPINGTDVVSIEIYRSAFLYNDLGRASAIGVIAMIPSILITVAYFRLAKPMAAR